MIETVIGLVVLLFGICLVYSQYGEQMTKYKKRDENIEWDGNDICLKKKNYPEMKDDYRTGVEDETKA